MELDAVTLEIIASRFDEIQQIMKGNYRYFMQKEMCNHDNLLLHKLCNKRRRRGGTSAAGVIVQQEFFIIYYPVVYPNGYP